MLLRSFTKRAPPAAHTGGPCPNRAGLPVRSAAAPLDAAHGARAALRSATRPAGRRCGRCCRSCPPRDPGKGVAGVRVDVRLAQVQVGVAHVQRRVLGGLPLHAGREPVAVVVRQRVGQVHGRLGVERSGLTGRPDVVDVGIALGRLADLRAVPMRVSSVGCSMKPTFQPQASPFKLRSASPLVKTAARHGQLHHGLLLYSASMLPVQAKAHRELVVDLIGHRGVHVDGLDVELVEWYWPGLRRTWSSGRTARRCPGR